MRLLAFRENMTRRTVGQAVGKLGGSDGLYVSSPGGEFEYFSVLGPVLQQRGMVTLAGDVQSAAVILYLLGTRRYALPTATFFFHEVRTFTFGKTVTVSNLAQYLDREREMEGRDAEAFEEWLRQMRLAQTWVTEFMSRRIGLRPAVFLDLMRQEATLDAREAVRYGIAHRIMPTREALETIEIIT